ncbi:MAG: ABC transporter ATP-binding protein [Clostridia bacterium]
MLTAKGVALHYGARTILQNVDVCLPDGQYTALIGPNGSGKTSLLSILAGVQRPDGGQVAYDGLRVRDMGFRARAQVFALVQQRETVAMPYTAREVIEMGLSPHRARFGQLAPEAVQAIDRLIGESGLAPLAGAQVNRLSGGEFQRVMLCRALAQRPRVLFLDEAMSEMDVRARLQMQQFLRKEIAQSGLTVLAVHHDISFAFTVSDRVIALKAGVVRAQGATPLVMTEPVLRDVFGVRSEIFPGKGVLIREAIEEPIDKREKEGPSS